MKKIKFEIDLLSKNYIQSKRQIIEHEAEIMRVNKERLKALKRVVDHIEHVAESLDDKEKLIIKNEVINGKKGKWYLEYFSKPTYYRIRYKAYHNFLRCL